MLWLLTLPFQVMFALLFGILFLPFVLLRWVVKLAVGLALLPFILLFTFLVVGVTIFAVVTALLLPLIPFALAFAFIWFLVKLASRPAHSLQ